MLLLVHRAHLIQQAAKETSPFFSQKLREIWMLTLLPTEQEVTVVSDLTKHIRVREEIFYWSLYSIRPDSFLSSR